jgi:transcriptional regulator with XRE-family HTH domain
VNDIPYGRPLTDEDITAMLASIGGQIRVARQARWLYLSDVAERVGVSQSVICRLELARREPSMYQLFQVCATLGLRLSGVLRVAEDELFPLSNMPWDWNVQHGEPRRLADDEDGPET